MKLIPLADTPILSVLVAVCCLLYGSTTTAAPKSPDVSQFIAKANSRTPAGAFVLNAYHHKMVMACHYEPTVDELKRFILLSEAYVDLLALITIAYDEKAFEQRLDTINCGYGQILKAIDLPEKYKALF